MTLVPIQRRRGKGGLARLHGDMDDLLSSFFGDWPEPVFEHRHWPALDIADNENELVIKAEVPGCKKDDIDISIQDRTLTISGEKKQEEEKKEKGYYHVERTYGSFRRDLNLPSDIDTTRIDAACKDGVLSITLPKTEKAKAVKVNIKGQ